MEKALLQSPPKTDVLPKVSSVGHRLQQFTWKLLRTSIDYFGWDFIDFRFIHGYQISTSKEFHCNGMRYTHLRFMRKYIGNYHHPLWLRALKLSKARYACKQFWLQRIFREENTSII